MMTFPFKIENLHDEPRMKRLEKIIDESQFFTFVSAYVSLIQQLKIAEEEGETPHSLLMDYLFFKLSQKRLGRNKNAK